MKKLIFIAQSKGGAGKSILTFLLAEKFKDAVIMDMDDATKTSSLQLAYRKPLQITFLNSNKVIDRGYFTTFLEKIASSKNSLFICDLGASVSEQLPYYFNDVGEFLPLALKEMGIELVIYNIVGGSNIFSQTMAYQQALCEAVKGYFNIRIYKNDYYEFNEPQLQDLEQYAAEHTLDIITFNISKDKNESTQTRIKEVLKSGEGIDKASLFSKMYFQNAIKELTI